MSAEAPLLIRGGLVFDSDSRSFRPASVYCRAGVIEALLPVDAAIPEGAAVIDASGEYVIPGLIDCHVHITSSGEAAALNNAASESLPVRAWKAAEYARRTLNAGITTVRDLGAAERLNIDLAKAIESGLIEGPRMLAAGLGVTMTGGHGHGFIAREADGPDDVRKAVREQLRAGATAIKLFASGGVLTAGVDPRSPSLTRDELTAGVEEAHKAFRVVAAHAQATIGIKNAVRAGVNSIEHGVWLDDEALQLMGEHGTYLVATLTAPWAMATHGAAEGVPQYMIDKSNAVLEDHARSFEAAVKAGIRVAMGTDQGTPLNRPGENAQEILRIAEHGLSPVAALLAATAWAADLLHVPAGRLNQGLAADLIILPADPTADLAALANPGDFTAIIQAGRVVRAAPRPTTTGGTK